MSSSDDSADQAGAAFGDLEAAAKLLVDSVLFAGEAKTQQAPLAVPS